ncbi:MAG: hypothetical protein FWF10_09175 [Clostridiales bacterium]|nr:hypothetical protein [Clostridiales bacterium]
MKPGVFSALYLFAGTVLLVGVSLVMHLFHSFGLHGLAKRRGIKGYGWSWMPVAKIFMQGRIADDCNLQTGHKKTYYRYILLFLWSGFLIASLVYCLLYAYWTLRAFDEMAIFLELTFYDQFGAAKIFLGLAFAIGTVFLIFYYIALHKLYKSCARHHTALFVLSIIFPIIIPFVIIVIGRGES